MNKTFLIAQTEFFRRWRSPWFVAATLLAPFLMAAIGVIPLAVTVLAARETTERLLIKDRTGDPVVAQRIVAALPERLYGELTWLPEHRLERGVRQGRLRGYLVLPEGLIEGDVDARYVAQNEADFAQQIAIRSALREGVRMARLQAAGASPEVVAALDRETRLEVRAVSGQTAGEGGLIAASALGYVMGFGIYFAVFIYGVMVMRSVIEEKQSRIVEVMASSARPFQLLMGKVIGVGAAGLSQLAIWTVVAAAGVALFGPILFDAAERVLLRAGPDAIAEAGIDADLLAAGPAELLALFRPGLAALFVAFFIGGYLVYASLFAAVGAAVEQEADAQVLQIPITLPVLVPVLFLFYVASEPESTLTAVLSILPFFSPILMMGRLAISAVPWWQVTLALALLLGTFVLLVGMAARIYRIGILMYGKKASIADLWRWAWQT